MCGILQAWWHRRRRSAAVPDDDVGRPSQCGGYGVKARGGEAFRAAAARRRPCRRGCRADGGSHRQDGAALREVAMLS
jgi:hypothetical protein